MSLLGLYTKFIAHQDERDRLVQLLLRAAEGMPGVPGCTCYVVNVAENDPDAVWVTELWTDDEAHQSSLSMEGVRALIQEARPLIASVEQIRLRPIGGKGIS